MATDDRDQGPEASAAVATWRQVRAGLKRLSWRQRARIPWSLFRAPGIPRRAKLVLVALVAYLIVPLDVISDFIPVLGQLDDLLVAAITLALLARLCPLPIVIAQVRALEGAVPALGRGGPR